MSMKVLHVVRSLRRETGGLAETVRNLSTAQRARGDRVTIVSLDPADAEEKSVVVLGEKSEGYGYSPRYTPWLRAHAADFDLIAIHGMWQYPGFGAWRALHGGRTPYVVFCHGMLDPWFKRTYPLKHVKKWLYWPWAEYRVLRNAAAVCFSVDEELRLARESFWLYRARERVVPIGIPGAPGDPSAQRTAFLAAYPAIAGRQFLLFLGRIHPKKGVELLLGAYAEVLARLPAAPALVIAGPCKDESYRQHLVAETERLGLTGAVIWVPMLTGELKWGALHACEAFVLFSHQENFGVAVVEALACGRPVLISDQINIYREIAADRAGLVGADTAEGGADILKRWRDLSSEARIAMGRAATDSFKRRFVIDRAAEAFSAMAVDLTGHR